MAQRVMVGDHVVLSDVDWVGSRGVVDDVLPRRSCLDNPPVANVDHVLLALSLDSPAFDETQATRFLVAAESCGFSFTLLLNKADLVPPEALQRRLAQLARWGYPAPLVVSCTTGMGVAAVGEVLRGRTSVVTGPSGAGKSSLINALRLGRHRRDDAGGRKSATGFGGDDGGGGSGPQAAQAPQAAAAAATATATSPSASTPELSVQMPGTASTSSTSASTTSTTTTSYSNDDQSSSSGGHVHSSDCGTSTSSGDTLPPLQASPSTLHLPASSAAAVAAAGTEAFSFIRVGDLTRRGQGTHTTTSVTLIRLPAGGLLADTPGFGLPGLDHLKPLELAACFPEFFAPLPPPTPTPTAAEEDGGDVDAAATMAAAAAAAAEAAEAAAVAKAAEAAATAEWQREAGGTKGQEDAGGTGCRYANCLHRGDAGCAVTARAPERHGMYLRLLTEIQEREEHDVKAIQMEKRQREGATRVKVGKGGVARVEAKLNTSKHRATARGAGKLDMLERPTGGRGMHLEKERPGQGGGRQRGPE